MSGSDRFIDLAFLIMFFPLRQAARTPSVNAVRLLWLTVALPWVVLSTLVWAPVVLVAALKMVFDDFQSEAVL